jgi:hypothetical protein
VDGFWGPQEMVQNQKIFPEKIFFDTDDNEPSASGVMFLHLLIPRFRNTNTYKYDVRKMVLFSGQQMPALRAAGSAAARECEGFGAPCLLALPPTVFSRGQCSEKESSSLLQGGESIYRRANKRSFFDVFRAFTWMRASLQLGELTLWAIFLASRGEAGVCDEERGAHIPKDHIHIRTYAHLTKSQCKIEELNFHEINFKNFVRKHVFTADRL